MPEARENTKRSAAFLALLRYAEHQQHDDPMVYRSLNENGHFANLSTHPNKPVTRWGRASTAAGAYAITYDTYEWAVSHGIAHDFSEASQDAIALGIIHRAGADPEIWDGHLEAAFALLRHKWSSLPGGSQQEITAEQAAAFFLERLHETPP